MSGGVAAAIEVYLVLKASSPFRRYVYSVHLSYDFIVSCYFGGGFCFRSFVTFRFSWCGVVVPS